MRLRPRKSTSEPAAKKAPHLRLLQACRQQFTVSRQANKRSTAIAIDPAESANEQRLPEDPAGSIRYFANPGPGFEERQTPGSPATELRAKAVAFYLPQFHSFPENDAWWGTGFTEWRNVSRGTPRYKGHYQPRIPRDLGFYDLSHIEVLKAQSELARAAGIQSFCFYYYWFNGKRLMQKPLDLFANSDIDQEFCILWANENWTRRWDGRDEDVLIAQDYDEEHEDAFIADTAIYMSNPRYTRVNGKPLFILYRPSLLPDTAMTIARWRDKWSAAMGITPLVYMVQSYTEFDPRPFDCDGAVEFPPHKVSRGLKRQNKHHDIFDAQYTGQIRRYADVVDKSLGEAAPPYPLIKTVSPHWDNDARREGRGVTFQGSTPKRYASWLDGAVEFAKQNPVGNESLVFINAWNEWAEAAYLEPDVHYGHAYLNATYRTLSKARGLLLVGHDAHANGAQMLLLALAKLFTQHFGLQIRILLKAGGKLLPQYETVAETTVLDNIQTGNLDQWLAECGCNSALFNTCVTGDLLEAADKAGIHCVSLVHELPALIAEYGLQSNVSDIAHLAHHVVFASQTVQAGFEQFEPVIRNAVSLKPQGLYKCMSTDESSRQRIRSQLGISESTRLVINLGYADHRKGFDLFALAAKALCEKNADIHFCWVGKRSKDMTRWFKSSIRKSLKGRLHFIEFTDAVQDWYAAADCLYLSSREDPFPSVVQEALSVGLPVLIHENATGFDEEVLTLVNQVSMDNPHTIADKLQQCMNDDSEKLRQHRVDFVNQHYSFVDYGGFLIELLKLSESDTSQQTTR